MRLVGQVEEIFVRELVPDLAQNRQTTDSRIKHSDGP
jgi:hypothetical protein